MAENSITQTTLEQQQQANSLKRKFQKLKSKFYELFFASYSTTSTQATTKPTSEKSHNNSIEKSLSTNALNSSMLISNCYYGYKSSLIETSFDDNHTSSSSGSTAAATNRNINKNATTLSTSSLNSPLTSQETNQNKLVSLMSSTSSSISSIATHQDKQTATTSEHFSSRLDQTGYDLCNHEFTDSINENNSNPFLNSKLTDLIQFNSDLDQLAGHFEAYLNLIDDQDNFFNINFMINYISYVILRNLNECDLKTLLKEMEDVNNNNNNNNNTNSLIKEIARQIYLQSENEPCGLKGCKLNIYLETEAETCLLTQFRFDSTCSLTTFEQNLTLKQDTKSGAASAVDNQSSSISNLTKRFLLSGKSKQASKKKLDNIIYLDSLDFDLIKRKLY